MPTQSKLTEEDKLIIKKLGSSYTDAHIADVIGCGIKSVWSYRNEMGIKKEYQINDRHDETIRGLYKTHSDGVIGKRIGQSRKWVRLRRAALGLHRTDAPEVRLLPTSAPQKQPKPMSEPEPYQDSARLMQSFLSMRAAC